VSDGDPGLVRLPTAGEDGVWNTPDDDAGDLSPRAGSRCIDAGDSAAAGVGELDVGGAVRRRDDAGTVDRGAGEAPIVDIGSWEFTGTTCRADFNGSGAVDSQDFFDFLAGFFAQTADFNQDGVVDSQDFFDFIGAFFEGCR